MSENPQLVTRRHIRFQIFQEDPAYLRQLLRQVPQLAFIEELARGENGIDLSRGDGAGQPFYARRVVHHRRDTAPGNRTKNHRRADPGVRQHQANLLAFLAVFLKDTSHEQGFGQQLAIGVRGEVNVFNAVFLRAIAVLRRQQRFIERFARADGHPRFHHDLVQHFTGDFTAVTRTRRVGHR